MRTIATLGTESTATPAPLETISVGIDVDLRIWDPEIVQRVVGMLKNQIIDIDVSEDLFPQTVVKLKFLSPCMNPEEIADLFHAKLISAKATMNHFERSREIQGYFAQTASYVTTAVRNEIETASEKLLDANSKEASDSLEESESLK